MKCVIVTKVQMKLGKRVIKPPWRPMIRLITVVSDGPDNAQLKSSGECAVLELHLSGQQKEIDALE